MGKLTGKIALITGASRGIGRGIALRLAKEGASIVVNYKSKDDQAEETVKFIKDSGGYAVKIKADVSNYGEADFLIKQVIKSFGKIDILVNNAGISYVGLFMDMKDSVWNEIIDLNLKGSMNCCHSSLQYMLSQKSGSIINISSMWGNVGASCEVVYSATKGAINMFTKSLAKELAPSGIRVNAVAPGVIDTEMNKWLNDDERKELEEEIPMGHFGTTEDIGNMVAFLASEEAKYVTGQIITVDGGMIS